MSAFDDSFKRAMVAASASVPPQRRKPTIYEALRDKLGREPTNAELKADVQRIKNDALVEVASRGGLPHQKRRGRKATSTEKIEYHVHEGRPSWHQSKAGGISGGSMIFGTRAEAEAFLERVKKLRPNEPAFIQEVRK